MDPAERSGYSQATISRLERGASRAAQDMVILTDIAQALGVPPAALGVIGESGRPPILDDVERRNFIGGAAGLAVAVLLPRNVVTRTYRCRGGSAMLDGAAPPLRVGRTSRRYHRVPGGGGDDAAVAGSLASG